RNPLKPHGFKGFFHIHAGGDPAIVIAFFDVSRFLIAFCRPFPRPFPPPGGTVGQSSGTAAKKLRISVVYRGFPHKLDSFARD
ncbi:MAG: hypothetical protein RR426_06865, partial [Oscillospiraceae bacterium]